MVMISFAATDDDDDDFLAVESPSNLATFPLQTKVDYSCRSEA